MRTRSSDATRSSDTGRTHTPRRPQRDASAGSAVASDLELHLNLGLGLYDLLLSLRVLVSRGLGLLGIPCLEALLDSAGFSGSVGVSLPLSRGVDSNGAAVFHSLRSEELAENSRGRPDLFRNFLDGESACHVYHLLSLAP